MHCIIPAEHIFNPTPYAINRSTVTVSSVRERTLLYSSSLAAGRSLIIIFILVDRSREYFLIMLYAKENILRDLRALDYIFCKSVKHGYSKSQQIL